LAAALRVLCPEPAPLFRRPTVVVRGRQAKGILAASCYSFLGGRSRQLMDTRLILINLLLKLGVAAAVSSSLVRSQEFKSLLFREERPLRKKIYLVLWIALPITFGVWPRFSSKIFIAGDLSFKPALLVGFIGGRGAGSRGGALMALPAVVHGEWGA